MKSIVNSIKMLLVMIVITGCIYPLFVTLIGKLVFNKQVNGTIIYQNNQAVGSELIGQNFTSDKYFQGRPSVSNYDTLPSAASNKSVTNKNFNDTVTAKYNELSIKYNQKDIPKEMYTASASGLDPHISKQATLIQIDKICTARHFTAAQKAQLVLLINNLTEKKDFGIFGEERINVLKLNLAVDGIK